MSQVVWAQSTGKEDLELVGGKGANLGEMLQIGLPVPPAFVATAAAFRKFVDESGVGARIFPALAKVDVDDNKALHDVSDAARKAILGAPMPKDLEKDILEAYRSLAKSEKEESPLVAVRSSATAEDLPEASFAGQQDTYLNVKGEAAVVEHVQRCWASLYTPRAIFYRVKHDFPHEKVSIAVVVQKMVDAEKAGVMFTKHPTSGEAVTIVEAAWGLGEGVVSGSVSPDNYVLAPDGALVSQHIAAKETMHVRGKGGKTVVEAVPKEKREARVLSDANLRALQALGRTIEAHYGTPQDVEWAFGHDGNLHLLQTRPITTIKQGAAGQSQAKQTGGQKMIVQGLGAAPGTASGKVAQIHDVRELDKCAAGDVLVTTMTTPDMVPAMRRAAAIVTDEGGMTCFPGEVQVLTDRGLVAMKDLVDLAAREPIRAYSVNPTTLEGEWRPIVRVMARDSEVVDVAVSQTGRAARNRVRMTPDHKVLTFEGPALVARPMREVAERQDAVTTVDRVTAPFSAGTWPVPPYLAGAIFTDGHWRLPGRKGAVEFIQKDSTEKRAFIERVRGDYESTFGGTMGSRLVTTDSVIRGERVQSTAMRLYDQRRAPAEAIEMLWQGLHTRILTAQQHDLADFLAGVADGDGSFSAREGKRLQIYCGDRHLTTAIVLACLRLGIQPTIAANRGCDNIQIVEGIDRILARTERLRGPVRTKLLGAKLLPARQILGDRVGEVDRTGRMKPYVTSNLLLDAAKLERALPRVADVALKLALERVISSPLRAKRAAIIGEPTAERVYNIEVEENHNYVVFTTDLTPVLVANCHAAIVSRELGVPCVVGTKTGTKSLADGRVVTVDGERGQVFEGALATSAKGQALAREGAHAQPDGRGPAAAGVKPLTATQVKVNISMPEAIDRAMRTDPDGVGLLRIEHIVLGLGKTPNWYLKRGKEQEYVDHLASEIRKIVEPMFPRQVWVRTLDAPTDEFRAMEGGEDEPAEHNPMLGFRGIRRGLRQPETLRAEFKAVKKLIDEGLTNVGVMLPLVNHWSEITAAKEIARSVGLEPHRDCEFGIMVEIPAAAIIIDQILDHEKLDFVSFGTNDLTQYTLAVDRNNENVANLYSEFHPAIARLIESTIKECRKRGVATSICGQAGSNPKFVEKLIGWGITSVSANIDALAKVRETIARTEQKLILDRMRSP